MEEKKKTPAKEKAKRVAAIGLSAALAITGIFAFLTATDSKDNIFKFGSVNIQLYEAFDSDQNGVVQLRDNSDFSKPDYVYKNSSDEYIATSNGEIYTKDVPSVQTEKILPHQVIEKAPWVVNTGKNDAYVYMKVGIPVESVVTESKGTDNYFHVDNDAQPHEVEMFTLLDEDKNAGINDGWTLIPFDNNTDYETVTEDAGTADEQTYHYYIYYYDTALQPDEVTPDLFSYVKFANITNRYEEFKTIYGSILSAYDLDGLTESIVQLADTYYYASRNDADKKIYNGRGTITLPNRYPNYLVRVPASGQQPIEDVQFGITPSGDDPIFGGEENLWADVYLETAFHQNSLYGTSVWPGYSILLGFVDAYSEYTIPDTNNTESVMGNYFYKGACKALELWNSYIDMFRNEPLTHEEELLSGLTTEQVLEFLTCTKEEPCSLYTQRLLNYNNEQTYTDEEMYNLYKDLNEVRKVATKIYAIVEKRTIDSTIITFDDVKAFLKDFENDCINGTGDPSAYPLRDVLMAAFNLYVRYGNTDIKMAAIDFYDTRDSVCAIEFPEGYKMPSNRTAEDIVNFLADNDLNFWAYYFYYHSSSSPYIDADNTVAKTTDSIFSQITYWNNISAENLYSALQDNLIENLPSGPVFNEENLGYRTFTEGEECSDEEYYNIPRRLEERDHLLETAFNSQSTVPGYVQGGLYLINKDNGFSIDMSSYTPDIIPYKYKYIFTNAYELTSTDTSSLYKDSYKIPINAYAVQTNIKKYSSQPTTVNSYNKTAYTFNNDASVINDITTRYNDEVTAHTINQYNIVNLSNDDIVGKIESNAYYFSDALNPISDNVLTAEPSDSDAANYVMDPFSSNDDIYYIELSDYAKGLNLSWSCLGEVVDSRILYCIPGEALGYEDLTLFAFIDMDAEMYIPFMVYITGDGEYNLSGILPGCGSYSGAGLHIYEPTVGGIPLKYEGIKTGATTETSSGLPAEQWIKVSDAWTEDELNAWFNSSDVVECDFEKTLNTNDRLQSMEYHGENTEPYLSGEWTGYYNSYDGEYGTKTAAGCYIINLVSGSVSTKGGITLSEPGLYILINSAYTDDVYPMSYISKITPGSSSTTYSSSSTTLDILNTWNYASEKQGW